MRRVEIVGCRYMDNIASREPILWKRAHSTSMYTKDCGAFAI